MHFGWAQLRFHAQVHIPNLLSLDHNSSYIYIHFVINTILCFYRAYNASIILLIILAPALVWLQMYWNFVYVYYHINQSNWQWNADCFSFRIFLIFYWYLYIFQWHCTVQPSSSFDQLNDIAKNIDEYCCVKCVYPWFMYHSTSYSKYQPTIYWCNATIDDGWLLYLLCSLSWICLDV